MTIDKGALEAAYLEYSAIHYCFMGPREMRAVEAVITAYLAAISPPSERDGVAWPRRKFCEVAERNAMSLANYIEDANDRAVILDAALAIRTLLSALTRPSDKEARR